MSDNTVQSTSSGEYIDAAPNLDLKLDENKKEKKWEQKVEQAARDIYQAAYSKGLRVGVYTASTVILEMLNDKSKPLMDRIRNVQRYCNVPIKNADKFLDTAPNSVNTEINNTNENESEESPNEQD